MHNALALLPDDVRRSLVAYRALLEGRFGERLRAATLFGSRARGDAEDDSDVDVGVVIDGLTERERDAAIDLAVDAWRSAGCGPILSPLVWSEAQWKDRLAAERRVALDILEEGVPI